MNQSTNPHKPKELPLNAKIVAQYIGRELTLKLAAASAHEKIYIPKTYRPNYPIERIIGKDKFLILIKQFGGILLDMPRCSSIHIHERNQRIIDLYHNKKEKVSKITEVAGLKQSMVFKIIKDFKR